MNTPKSIKRITIIAKILTFALFLALIRCIVEPMRLNTVSAQGISFEQAEPFLIASLVVAFSLLIITIFWFKQFAKLIIVFSVLTLAALVVIKVMYKIP